MPLIFLGGPSLVSPAGTVTEIRNVKERGALEMHWSFEQQDGWYQASRRYTNTLRVFTSKDLVGPIQIQQAVLGIGAVQGSYYRFPLNEYVNGAVQTATICEQDTASFAQSIDIDQESEDARQWLVKINYGPYSINHQFGSSNVQEGSINPTESYPEVHWSSAKYEVHYATDQTGNPYVNTVGDPLENVPPTEETRTVLQFTRNEAQYQESWASQYRDAVNSDSFLGYLPNTVKCKDIQGQKVYSADYGNYWRVSYEFEFRIGFPKADGTTTGWTTQILNAGLRQNVNGVAAQITLNGALITSPVALQQDGTYQPTADPFYLDFVQYGAMPFSFLNIPVDVLTSNQ